VTVAAYRGNTRKPLACAGKVRRGSFRKEGTPPNFTKQGACLCGQSPQTTRTQITNLLASNILMIVTGRGCPQRQPSGLVECQLVQPQGLNRLPLSGAGKAQQRFTSASD
jgi:hypothetical protein